MLQEITHEVAFTRLWTVTECMRLEKEKKNKSKNLIDKVCPDMPEQKIKTSPDKADKEESKKIKVEKLESVY